MESMSSQSEPAAPTSGPASQSAPTPTPPPSVGPWIPQGAQVGRLFAPLIDDDPPSIGGFWLDARASVRPSGIAYLGHGTDGTAVLVVALSNGAAEDAAARERFAGEVNKLHVDTVVARGGADQDEGRLAGKFRSEDDDPPPADAQPQVPWVALAYNGAPAAVSEADRLLAAVALVNIGALGPTAGPGYQLSWINDQRLGRSRIWPLPWPGRTDRAGWMTLMVSWLLVVLLAALAILIAVLLFQKSSSSTPPPPVPTNQSASASSSSSQSQSASGSPSPSSASPSSGSGSPSSGSRSPSNGSGSPSSASGSPTSAGSSPGPGGEGSDHPSMESPGTGSASGPAGTTPPNRRL